MLTTEMKKLKLQSELVSVERDCHEEDLIGIISDVDDTITAMHLYTDDGEYDGFTVFETDQITEVYWGNREHKAISSLISKEDSVTTPRFKSKTFQDIIVELASQSDSICLYPRDNEDIFDIAQIEQFDELWFKLNTYDRKRSLSRLYKIVLRDSISRIVVNDPYQQKIVALHHAGL